MTKQCGNGLRLVHGTGDPVERNLVKVVVKIRVGSARDDEQFLVVPLELLEGVLAEIA